MNISNVFFFKLKKNRLEFVTVTDIQMDRQTCRLTQGGGDRFSQGGDVGQNYRIKELHSISCMLPFSRSSGPEVIKLYIFLNITSCKYLEGHFLIKVQTAIWTYFSVN